MAEKPFNDLYRPLIKLSLIRFIGEEECSEGKKAELTDAPTWIIDPVDGTLNFVHSFPHSCISIALLINKTTEIGIILNPLVRQLFTARRGQGAFYNGNRIQVSGQKELSKSLIMAELGTSRDPEKLVVTLENFKKIAQSAHGLVDAAHFNINEFLFINCFSTIPLIQIPCIGLGRLEPSNGCPRRRRLQFRIRRPCLGLRSWRYNCPRGWGCYIGSGWWTFRLDVTSRFGRQFPRAGQPSRSNAYTILPGTQRLDNNYYRLLVHLIVNHDFHSLFIFISSTMY